jgi:hypothetical protein
VPVAQAAPHVLLLQPAHQPRRRRRRPTHRLYRV